MTNNALISSLRNIVGKRQLLTQPRDTERYRKGFRSGEGEAIAVVIPNNLLEMWQVLKACVEADKILILQAANTGLTEGSTPKGHYDRDVVILSTLRMDKIHLINDGEQIVSQPGGTLFQLEKMLRPLGREPHSVIGSSCIGASILGGVCNNSGGSLVRRGPVYTELSLYAQITQDGQLELVNHLGIELGDTPEEILGRLDKGDIPQNLVRNDTARASQEGYEVKVADIEAQTPARYNADPEGLYEASGCAGKLAVFAVRLDTFETEQNQKIYYIGTNDAGALTEQRRRLLTELDEIPASGEYLHRECFDIARTYGKDTLLMINWFGTDRLPLFFAIKGALDARLNKLRFLPKNLVDHTMQVLTGLLPEALPKRMMQFRKRFEHHLILKISAHTSEQTEIILNETVGKDGWFLCDEAEAKKAMLHRFAAAGAAVRMQAVKSKTVEDVIALDIALRRNDRDWCEVLPDDIACDIVGKLYYGHFMCHVFHQDYLVRKGADVAALKAKMLKFIDERGAEYPAEHNVGHLYKAKPSLASHYKGLDPTNSMNPGIGKTSREKHYGALCGCGSEEKHT
jgi:D-lactate dehydrogenase